MRPATENNQINIWIAIYKLHGNHKPKIYNINRYTQKRERNPNITLRIVIKSQENKRKEEQKRPTKTTPKQLTKWQ